MKVAGRSPHAHCEMLDTMTERMLISAGIEKTSGNPDGKEWCSFWYPERLTKFIMRGWTVTGIGSNLPKR
jgi:hypothetical protein